MNKRILMTLTLIVINMMVYAGGKLTLRGAIEQATKNGKKTAVIADPQGIIRAKIETQEATAQYLACDSKNETIGKLPEEYLEIANLVAENLKEGFENSDISFVDYKKVPRLSENVADWENTDYGVIIYVEISVLYVPELSEKHRATKLEIETRLKAKYIDGGKMKTIVTGADLGNTPSEYFKHPDCYDKLNQFEAFITPANILVEASKQTTQTKLDKFVAKQNKKYGKSKK